MRQFKVTRTSTKGRRRSLCSIRMVWSRPHNCPSQSPRRFFVWVWGAFPASLFPWVFFCASRLKLLKKLTDTKGIHHDSGRRAPGDRGGRKKIQGNRSAHEHRGG